MKLLTLLLLAALTAVPALAQTGNKTEWVPAYTTRTGRRVRGYWRAPAGMGTRRAATARRTSRPTSTRFAAAPAAPSSEVTESTTVSSFSAETGSIDATQEPLPDTGGSPLLMVGAGLVLAAGALGLRKRLV